ncbi:MAG: hypothetical protein RR459_04385 [Christensenellaceae bacterium]
MKEPSYVDPNHSLGKKMMRGFLHSFAMFGATCKHYLQQKYRCACSCEKL